MEIIDSVAQIVIAFAGITGLILMVMFFAFFMGDLASRLFED